MLWEAVYQYVWKRAKQKLLITVNLILSGYAMFSLVRKIGCFFSSSLTIPSFTICFSYLDLQYSSVIHADWLSCALLTVAMTSWMKNRVVWSLLRNGLNSFLLVYKLEYWQFSHICWLCITHMWVLHTCPVFLGDWLMLIQLIGLLVYYFLCGHRVASILFRFYVPCIEAQTWTQNCASYAPLEVLTKLCFLPSGPLWFLTTCVIHSVPPATSVLPFSVNFPQFNPLNMRSDMLTRKY